MDIQINVEMADPYSRPIDCDTFQPMNSAQFYFAYFFISRPHGGREV